MKRISVPLLMFLVFLFALSACGEEIPASTPEAVDGSPAQLQAVPTPDPSSILRDLGPQDQREHDLDWSTLSGIASVETEGVIVHLAQGSSAAGQEQLLLAIIEPEPEAEGWRPRSALVGSIEASGPTFLTAIVPNDEIYLGFAGVEQPAVIEYDGVDGSVKSVQLNTAQGLILLPNARKLDPGPRVRQEISP